jgi:hypothetical protein
MANPIARLRKLQKMMTCLIVAPPLLKAFGSEVAEKGAASTGTLRLRKSSYCNIVPMSMKLRNFTHGKHAPRWRLSRRFVVKKQICETLVQTARKLQRVS